MKKLILTLTAVVGVVVAATVISTAAGPPPEIAEMIIQRLIEVFERVAALVPEFIRPIFDFIIELLRGRLLGTS